MVLVALEGAYRAVQVGVCPARVIGGIVDPLPHSFKSVGLNIPLEHDPQPDLVGQVEHARVGWIVGGADRVDTHGLHEGEILAHPPLVEDAPLVGAHLVAVNPIEGEGLPVGRQHSILDGHPTEADAQRSGTINSPSLPFDAHPSVVEDRIVGAPRAHAADLDAATAIDALVDSLKGVREGPQAIDLQVAGEGATPSPTHAGLDGRVADPCLVVGVDPQVLDVAGREVTQAHRAEDARKPPLVLVFEVGAGAELMDAHGDRIDAGSHGLGHVELVGEA